ncbi:MAG TPA: cobalamin biosynthesis protein, partial [Actinomycetes bacterium]|nr:cobalamin biosynthesis protein [Actinomycetes bacterium]
MPGPALQRPARRRGRRAARAAGIGLGLLADAAFGDPRRGHPVAAFGRCAGVVERRLYGPGRASGALFTAVAAGGPIALGVLGERAGRDRPVVRAALTAAATWAVLGGRSLAAEGSTMA